MRSSRRKRNQYVVTLRDEVSRLRQRTRDAREENALLRQLRALWERTVREVEAEVQDGVRRQLGLADQEGVKMEAVEKSEAELQLAAAAVS